MFKRKPQDEISQLKVEEAARRANNLIGLLKQRLGDKPSDTSDPRIFVLNTGQEGFVDGFTEDKLLFSTTITVNFYEVTHKRTKLFQYDQKAIIGSQYEPTFVHYILRKMIDLAQQYGITHSSAIQNQTDESPWSGWGSNQQNSDTPQWYENHSWDGWGSGY